jgi:hypothetical protein
MDANGEIFQTESFRAPEVGENNYTAMGLAWQKNGKKARTGEEYVTRVGGREGAGHFPGG